jgi:hypothetical protein
LGGVNGDGTVDARVWAEPIPFGIRRHVRILTWLPAYDCSYLLFNEVRLPEARAVDGLARRDP